MSTPETPRAATALLRQVQDWPMVQVNHARGQLEFGGLSETEDGNGKRKRIELIETVDSVVVRAMHADGRAVVALWMRRIDRGGWSLDMAFRGRLGGELAPKRLSARQLTAFVAAPDPEAALAAAAACAPKAQRAIEEVAA